MYIGVQRLRLHDHIGIADGQRLTVQMDKSFAATRYRQPWRRSGGATKSVESGTTAG